MAPSVDVWDISDAEAFVVQTIGDVVTEGLAEDTVRQLVTQRGTELAVVIPSTSSLTSVFQLASVSVPPMQGQRCQGLSAHVVSMLWHFHLQGTESSNLMSSAFSLLWQQRASDGVGTASRPACSRGRKPRCARDSSVSLLEPLHRNLE